MLRRSLLRTAPALLATPLMTGCDSSSRDERGGAPGASATEGRLSFRPQRSLGPATGEAGPFPLPLSGGAPALGYVPPVEGDEPLRLVVLLHGAGGVPDTALGLLREEADAHGLLLVAVKSVGRTWDVITGGFGPDVERIDEALRRVSRDHRVAGYTIGGFSDGASYALSIGIANGDVFDSVIAFSPGFSAARTAEGDPRFFLSHGVQDKVLPIERCSRRIVPALRESGYEVEYREFEGGHTVPAGIRRAAVEWLVQA